MNAVEMVLDALRGLQRREGTLLTPEKVDEYARAFTGPLALSEDEIQYVIGRIEEDNDIFMNIGSTLKADSWTPWLNARKASLPTRYWDRYETLLRDQGMPDNVIAKMYEVTDHVLDFLEDPEKEGSWHRKGLVLGHVQSGKTANYIGLINKAADAGYRVIIVIAGIQESLRRQTQLRIDEGFTGWSTQSEGLVGVGLINREFRPTSYTGYWSDFGQALVRRLSGLLSTNKEPTVFVVKKNATTLRYLIEWLSRQNQKGDGLIHDLPMLLIDDEADNASVNTAKNPDEATRINGQIRQVFQLFAQSCYVGYTATPFANIFIDKDVQTEDHGEDLFPSDFIYSLEPPSNYMGAGAYFSEQEYEEQNHLRPIEDASELLPISHKKDFEPEELPESLLEAIRTFLLALTIRSLRGDWAAHASMLINVSRFVDVQARLKSLVLEHMHGYRRDISHYSKLNVDQALENHTIRRLYDTWTREFAGPDSFSWDEVQAELHHATASVRVVQINSSSEDRLDYASYKDSGLKVIAIGGFSLSRGLTLEGLCVSYFRRNSVMYDTLLQMARWFGYRPRYEDLCRVWMEPETIGWFMHIHEAMEELRTELREMSKAGLEPREFGLKVQSHPGALLVTARNKMRSADEIKQEANLANQLVETHRVTKDPEKANENLVLLDSVVQKLSRYRVASPREYSAGDGCIFYHAVPAEEILEFVDRFHVHPDLLLVRADPIRNYIRKGANAELAYWDVVVYGLENPDRGVPDKLPSGIPLVKQTRTGSVFQGRLQSGYKIGTRQKIATTGIERIGFTPEEVRTLKQGNGDKDVSDVQYRRNRSRPLLMLHWLSLYEERRTGKDKKPEKGPVLEPNVVAFGLSFPPTTRADAPVEYVVNKTWMESVHGAIDDTDEEILQDGPVG